MRTAPPTEPGMPINHSKLAKDLSFEYLAISGRKVAAPTFNNPVILSSSIKSKLGLMIVPEYPSSENTILDPLTITTSCSKLIWLKSILLRFSLESIS